MDSISTGTTFQLRWCEIAKKGLDSDGTIGYNLAIAFCNGDLDYEPNSKIGRLRNLEPQN